MKPNATDQSQQYSIGMLLLPGFNANAAFAFLDSFRAANYIQSRKLYSWEFLSLRGGAVRASNEATIEATRALSRRATTHDLIVVNASWAPERFQSEKLRNWLLSCSQQGATLAAIDTGAFVIANAGLFDGYRATVHYDHIAAFRELFPVTTVEEVLYVCDRDRMSCSGGVATVDMSLHLIQLHHGIELANAAASYILKDRHRAGSEQQAKHTPEPVGYKMPEKLRDAIVLMERNLEEPLSTGDLARHVGISQRQLARLFKRTTGMTPIRFYINLRLDRARGLITQTDMLVADVASACGFGTSEQFSRSYSDHFKIAPSRDRTEGRIPFQFRSFPSHAALQQ